MKIYILCVFIATLIFNVANAQGKHYSNEKANKKFTGIWEAKFNGKIVKLTLESINRRYIKAFDSYIDVVEGNFVVLDASSKVLYGATNSPIILTGIVDGNDPNLLNSTYEDSRQSLVAEARLKYNPSKQVLLLTINNTNKGSIKFKTKDKVEPKKEFRIPMQLTLTKK